MTKRNRFSTALEIAKRCPCSSVTRQSPFRVGAIRGCPIHSPHAAHAPAPSPRSRPLCVIGMITHRHHPAWPAHIKI